MSLLINVCVLRYCSKEQHHIVDTKDPSSSLDLQMHVFFCRKLSKPRNAQRSLHILIF